MTNMTRLARPGTGGWTLRRTCLAACMALGALLAGCSRTVTWVEEVPLNTGEVIWVKREVTYKLQGAGGNPLDLAYRPDWTERISFEWKGKKVYYVGDISPLLLAVSPNNQQLVLVTPRDANNWVRSRDYPCKKPFYRQLVHATNEQEWIEIPNVEPWLYNMPRNLMAKRGDLGEMKKRYSSSDRQQEDRTMTIQSPSAARIDSNYQPERCK